MDFNTIVKQLDARNDPNTFDYDVLISRLQLVKGSYEASWSHDDTCTAVSLAFSDFAAADLTANQVLRIAGIIQNMWRTYPVNLEGRTRKEILLLYIAGHCNTVSELSLQGPPSRPSSQATPAAQQSLGSNHNNDQVHISGPPNNSHNIPHGQSSAISAVARYYTNDRKYGGLDNESLTRARSHFSATCDKFGVLGNARKLCIDLALKHSVHNLPQLGQDILQSHTEEELWNLIERRVYTADRMNRIRSEWQTTSLKTFPSLPNETTVQTFERIIERLSLLQSQLPPMYHNDQAMVDNLHDLIQGQNFESSIISQNESNPHQLIDKIKFALHSSRKATPSPPTPLSSISALFVDDPAGEDIELDVKECVDENDPNTVYYVLRKYTPNSVRPHETQSFRRQPFIGPSVQQPCNICGSPDHWARDHHKSRTNNPRYSSHLTNEPSHPDEAINSIPTFTAPLTALPPDLSALLNPLYSSNTTIGSPRQHHSVNFIQASPLISDPPPDRTHEEVTPVFHTSTVIPHNKFPVMDSGTFADLMGTAWMRANSPTIVSQVKPSKTTFSFGNDRPPTVGCVSVQLNCKDTTGQSLTFVLPEVNTVDSTPALLLFGYQSQGNYGLLTRPHNNTIIKLSVNYPSNKIRVIQGQLVSGHLCLVTEQRTTCPYIKQELALVHRQFGQKLVADVLKAFPEGTFTNNDIKLLNEIAASCKPCQEYAQLPRRPRYNLPSRPVYFNRLIQTDSFTIPGYPQPVLDIKCNDTDFGLGMFLQNKSAEMIFALLYIKWFTVIGLPETALGNRGGVLENKLLSDGIASLGVPYRFAPTEAPWSIGRVE